MRLPAATDRCRAAALVLALLLPAAACAGCGGSGKARTVLETKRTIVALALRGSDVAWLAGNSNSPFCPVSLWLRTPRGTVVLPLPRDVSASGVNDCSVFDSYGFAAVALAGTNVGWLVNEPGGNSGVITEGASSGQPRATATFVRVLTTGGIVSPVGAMIGGVAAMHDGLLWGTAHIAYRVTRHAPPKDSSVPYGTCDLDLSGAGCQTRVDGGGVFTWSGGVSTRVPGLPPATALAADGDLFAVATLPRSRWTHGAARIGSVEVRDRHSRIVMRVTAPQEIDRLALSQHLLAVGDGLRSTVSVYEVPSGRLLRHIALASDGLTRITAVGHRLVLWNGRSVLTLDPWSGRRRMIVGFPPPSRSATALTFYWTVTAVAVDGNRLAWAQTSPGGISVVNVVDAG